MGYIRSFIWDLVVILSVIVLLLPLIFQGYLSLSHGFFVLLAFLSFLIIGRGLKGDVERLVFKLFRIGTPLTSLLILTIILSGGGLREIITLLSYLGVLLIMLIGVYLMVGGKFSKWDSITIFSIIIWIVPLMQGYIPFSFGSFVLVALIIFIAVGRRFRSGIGRLIFKLLRIGIPFTSFLTLTIILGGGSLEEIMTLISALGVLLIMLVGLYFMLRRVFSS